MSHALAEIIEDAANDRFPPVDGGWHRVDPWKSGIEAVVAFTGHAVFAVHAGTTDESLAEMGADGFGGAHDPRLLAELAGPEGWIDSLDVLLVGRGTGPTQPGLVPRPTSRPIPGCSSRPPTVTTCRSSGSTTRNGRRSWCWPAVWPGCQRSASSSTLLIGAARALRWWKAGLRLIPEGELVVAAAAPGNAASLRALLSAGFVPVGSLQLFRRV